MGLLSLLSASDRSPAARRRRQTFIPDLGLGVERLESRVVLSHTAAAVAAPVANNINVGQILGDAINFNNIKVTNVNLTSLSLVDGVVKGAGTVTGTIGGLPFTTQITDFTLDTLANDPATPAAECAILHLELAPIDLDLLGLHVDTSAICLDVTATEGGGVLGNLLCGLADGTITLPLGQVPLGDLTTGLTGLLNGALAQAPPGQGGGGGGGAQDICDGECEILDLTLGPIDLSLLGLNVSLDNCANGPVQVCVSASRGEGLLGNLLCGLTNPNGNRLGLLKSLNRLLGDLDDLLGQIG